MSDEFGSVTRPIATVDAVIMTIEDGSLKVVLHRRPEAPFQGVMALPGGWIHTDEDVGAEAAVRRILRDKLGLRGFFFEQLMTFSGPDRDPRGWSVSIAFMALVPREELPRQSDGYSLVAIDRVPTLAFDHDAILETAIYRLRGKGAYSVLPAKLIGETFTLSQLQAAYECVLGTKLDKSSFRRKIRELDLLEKTGAMVSPPMGRPAEAWRLVEDKMVFNRTLGGAG